MTEGTMTTMELRTTIYEVDSGVGVITLNRPDRLNAWTARMALEYRALMVGADADPDVRVIVITGAGRGFCAGADLKALDNMADAGSYDGGVGVDGGSGSGAGDKTTELGQAPRAGSALFEGALRGLDPDLDNEHSFPLALSKPVIAAVNGPAAGVGFVLMCFADIRFAAAGAKLTTSFGRLGLPAEHGVSWILSRLVGPARAADLLFSSRVVRAEEAENMGLINKVVERSELMEFVLDYAKRMAGEIAPSSLAAMKAQLYADLRGDVGPGAARAVDLMRAMVEAPDFAEGVKAFQAGRPPQFLAPK
ncbi:MAG: enoyl-CoA hydratase-related protein [Acidimicrobiales bacterium]